MLFPHFWLSTGFGSRGEYCTWPDGVFPQKKLCDDDDDGDDDDLCMTGWGPGVGPALALPLSLARLCT